MKRKLKLVKLIAYHQVASYTLLDVDGKTPTDKFFDEYKVDSELVDKSNDIHSWLEDIGENRSARKNLFRKERNAVALPPEAHITGHYYEPGERTHRLYCVWVDESIVILLSGSEKTHNEVMKCEKCKPHFIFANSIAYQVSKMIEENKFKFKEKSIKNVKKIVFEA